MIQLLLPVGIFAFKEVAQYIVNNEISEGTTKGATKAIYEVEKKALQFQREVYINIIINIVVLFFAIYILGTFTSNKELITLVVSSVYLSSILYSLYSFVKYRRAIYNFFIIQKCNLQKFIFVEIFNEARSEAKNEIDNLNFFKKPMNQLFGENSSAVAKEIASVASKIAKKNIIFSIVNLAVIFSIYVLVFRFMVAPTMIEDSTHLSWFQSLIYPIFFSIDYFFDTTLLSIIV